MASLVERLRDDDKNGSAAIAWEAADEIERLNKWADGFSEAQLKERRLCEERIKEMQRKIDKYALTLMMIREGAADPRGFAAETLIANG